MELEITVHKLKGNGVNRAKTHCPKGHPYSAENTYVTRGRRQCNTCRTEKRPLRSKLGIKVCDENGRRILCQRGHPMSGTNLILQSSGRRLCRACASARFVPIPPEQAREYAKQWRDKNRDKVSISSRKEQLKEFGLTPDSYDRMLERQAGVCAICKSTPSAQRMAVDHCHKTGKVRGLLCGNCNIGLGLFRDSSSLLINAVCYLTPQSLQGSPS